MAAVDINIIKEWFKNLKKPTQEQFWAWLDSFRHKWEKVPLDDVDGLTSALQQKADLVNGVVPESQLPFTINTNEVIAIGAIAVTANNVHISLHESGSNKVRINGQILERTFPDDLPFTPVIDGKKFLRIVAKNQPGLFFVKQSSESDEPQEPTLDVGEIHVRLILVTPDGSYIDPQLLNGYKTKAEDTWRTLFSNKLGNYGIFYGDERTCFSLEENIPSSTTKYLRYIEFAEETTRDVEFTIKNNTFGDVIITNIATEGLIKGFLENTPYTIPSKGTVFAKYNHTKNVVEILKVGSNSSANFPTDGNNGDSLEKDSTNTNGVKWVDRLSGLSNTFAPFWNGSKFINSIISQVSGRIGIGTTTPEELLHVNGRIKATSIILSNNVATAIANRLRSDGTRPYYADNSAVEKPLAYVEDINSTNVTSAINNATAGQKSTMRIALLGSAVPASPVITDVLPMFMVKNTDQYPVITGLNLTLLDPTNIFFKDSGNVQSNAEAYQNINTFSIATKWKLASSITDGIYDMKINNGSVVQGLSTGQVQVVTTDPKIVMVPSDWKFFIYGNNTPNANFQIANDFVKVARSPSTVVFPKDDSSPLTACRVKSKNIFKGALASSWEIVLDVNIVSGNNGSTVTFPIIALSETSDADFSSIDSLILNHSLIFKDPAIIAFEPSIASYANGSYRQIVIKKTGNKLLFVHRDTPYGVNSSTFIKTQTIDTSKDYGLVFTMPSSVSNSGHSMAYNVTARIKN